MLVTAENIVVAFAPWNVRRAPLVDVHKWGGWSVADYRVDTPGEKPKPYIHLPLWVRETYAEFIVRTRSSAAGQVEALKRQFLAMDPEIVFLDVGTLRGAANVRLIR